MGTLTLEQAVSKIRKLQALSTSSNVHEAALAASRAAQIMQDYQIEEAAISNIEEEREQVAEYSLEQDDPLFTRGSKLVRKKTHWRMSVASGCATVCNCSVFWRGAYIRFIGRVSDVQAARYLYDLIAPQVDRLAEETWRNTYEIIDFDVVDQKTEWWNEPYGQEDEKPNRKSWLHAFRLGCAKEVKRRMREQHKQRWTELEKQAKEGQRLLNDANSGQALLVINNRLAKVTDYEKSLGLEPVAGPSLSDYSGYHMGQKAGSRVNIGGNAKGGLPSPKKQVR